MTSTPPRRRDRTHWLYMAVIVAVVAVVAGVALVIGLVVGNLLHPGTGLKITDSTAAKGAELAGKAQESGGVVDFISHIIPTTLFSALTDGNVLQALFV